MLRGRPFARRHSAGGFGSLAPNQITSATKRFWHDAQDDSTITVATGVSAWVDKFGNGYDVAQGTGGKQPTKSTAAFGGRQSLLFTAASSQELWLTNGPLVTAVAGGTDVAYQVYFALWLTSVTGVHYFHGFNSSTSVTPFSDMLTNGALWQYQRRDDAAATSLRTQSGAIPAVSTGYIMRCGYTGTNAAWVVNGVTLTTAGSSDFGAMTLDRMIYGALGGGAGASSSFLDGYIGEAIGYSGAVSAPEEAQLMNYLKAKWGVAF